MPDFMTFFSRFRRKHLTRPVRDVSETSRSFLRDESGAIAIIFVVSLIPIILMLGAAVDYSRAALARSQAQDALDAATLAAVKQVGTLTDGEIRSLVEAYVSANSPSGTSVNISLVEIERNPSTLKVWADGSTDMTFMRMANIEETDFSISSKTVANNKTLEVVMVLDNSGSMGSSAGGQTRISALRDAANDLVDILDAKKADEDALHFGIVPFTHLVRLDEGREEATWLDQDAKSSVHRENLPEDANRFDLFATMTDPSTGQAVEWEGCVEARTHPYDVEDTSPESSKGDSYFIPFFHPDRREPSNNKASTRYSDYYLPRYGYDNNQSWSDKKAYGYYYQQTIKDSSSYSPNRWCDMPRILPLTNDMTTISSHIGTMRASGATNIHMGTIWGLRLLSPQTPYTEGRSYDDEDNIKALIVMTDGNNTYYSSYYHAYGWSTDGRISGSSSVVNEMNARTVEACEAAQAEDILVFTIYFGSPSTSTASMLSSCASESSYYKSVGDADELTAVFQDIASELSKLRLVE